MKEWTNFTHNRVLSGRAAGRCHRGCLGRLLLWLQGNAAARQWTRTPIPSSFACAKRFGAGVAAPPPSGGHIAAPGRPPLATMTLLWPCGGSPPPNWQPPRMFGRRPPRDGCAGLLGAPSLDVLWGAPGEHKVSRAGSGGAPVTSAAVKNHTAPLLCRMQRTDTGVHACIARCLGSAAEKATTRDSLILLLAVARLKL